MRLLNDEDYRILQEIVVSNQDFDRRVIAHIPILYEKDIPIHQIERIYGISRSSIYLYLKYLQLFGLSGYFENDIVDLRKLIEDEEYRREKILLSLKRGPNIFHYLTLPFVWLIIFVGKISTMFTVFTAYVISLFEPKRSKKTNIENNIKIEKGASSNYILQVGTLNINSKEFENEHLVTNSKEELIEKVEDLIKSNIKYDLGNNRANALFDAAQKANSNPELPQTEKDNRINFYAVLIVGLILYSTTFKGGVSTISVFGIVIAVSLRSCTFFGSEVPVGTLTPDNIAIDTALIKDNTPKSVGDTISLETDVDPIFTVEEYQEKVSRWYELDSKCFALSAIGSRQKVFIDSYDYVDHSLEDYYIDSPDNMYYFHVVSYSDVKQAAFQMNFLNQRTGFKAKILEKNSVDGVLYAVVIGKFKGEEISKACQLVDSWATECMTGENDAGYLFNGY